MQVAGLARRHQLQEQGAKNAGDVDTGHDKEAVCVTLSSFQCKRVSSVSPAVGHQPRGGESRVSLLLCRVIMQMLYQILTLEFLNFDNDTVMNTQYLEMASLAELIVKPFYYLFFF